MAMVALVFSEYLFKAVWPQQDVSIWVLKGTALLAIMFITSLNGMGTNVGTRAAKFFPALKIFGLGSIVVIGLVTFTRFQNQDGSSPVQPTTTSVSDPNIWMMLGNFTDATLAALFAYGGWESVSPLQCGMSHVLANQKETIQIGLVAGEITEPQYTLPCILSLSMIIVVTLFTLASITFYNTLSLSVLQRTNAVAIVSSHRPSHHKAFDVFSDR